MTGSIDPKPLDLTTLLLVFVGLALFGLNLFRNMYFWHDDAYITLRYAINFAETGSLGWNPGERVEGYTEPLHLVIISSLLKLGIQPVLAARLVNLSALVILIWSVVGALRDTGVDRRLQALAFAGVIAAPAAAIWLVGGLGGLLAAAMVAATCRLMMRALSAEAIQASITWAIFAGLLAGMGYLARPDTTLFFFGMTLATLFVWDRPLGVRLSVCTAFGVVFICVLGAHLAWRYGYYGDILPNTYYAKVGVDLATRMSRIVTYFGKSLLLYVPVITVAGLVFVATFFVRMDRRVLTLAGGAAVFAAYLVWSGGDHMPAARVFLPLVGPAAILVGLGLTSFKNPIRTMLAAAALVCVVVPPFLAKSFPKDPAAYVGTIVGEYIAENWPKGSLIGLNTAGSTPYFARENTFIDMLGLNDRAIGKREGIKQILPRQALPGHFKGDGAYVFERAPDYIIAGSAEGRSLDEPWFLTGYELSKIDGFLDCYQKHEVMIPYSLPEAERIDYVANPLPFTYYQRTCPRPDK